tara:strand:+ start:20437 stop:21897 length:1461 start_codon:yes stop_codon:yes gene_type:complete
MLFNSWQYILFFPVVVAAYFTLPHRARWAWLLGASYVFYACWKPAYLILIVASTLVDYVVGLRMDGAESKGSRKAWLGVSLAVNLGLLFTFKYLGFANEVLRGLLHSLGWTYEVEGFDLLLPVGISFYTFQTLSYSIDVYRGDRKAERHLGYFALYVSYFPQLVAGPIERSTRLLPQLWAEAKWSESRATEGLRLIGLGVFKKVVIADRLAVFVDGVYGDPEAYPGGAALLATVFFAFQIYCDFSAYSDIAIGSAKVLGHDLMRNFDRPYFATSIGDFWSRWHISLSTWFRDYVYIPLGGNRVREVRWFANIAIVFVVSGLWHGASWCFVIWGALHGTYFAVERVTRKLRVTCMRALGITRWPWLQHSLAVVTTFTLVLFAWIFFRARSLGEAGLVIERIASGWGLGDGGLKRTLSSLGMRGSEFDTSVGLIVLLLVVQALHGKGLASEWLARLRMPVRWAAYVLVTLVILNYGVTQEVPFLYFQF